MFSSAFQSFRSAITEMGSTSLQINTGFLNFSIKKVESSNLVLFPMRSNVANVPQKPPAFHTNASNIHSLITMQWIRFKQTSLESVSAFTNF